MVASALCVTIPLALRLMPGATSSGAIELSRYLAKPLNGQAAWASKTDAPPFNTLSLGIFGPKSSIEELSCILFEVHSRSEKFSPGRDACCNPGAKAEGKISTPLSNS